MSADWAADWAAIPPRVRYTELLLTIRGASGAAVDVDLHVTTAATRKASGIGCLTIGALFLARRASRISSEVDVHAAPVRPAGL